MTLAFAEYCISTALQIRVKNGDKTLSRVDVYGRRWELIVKVCQDEGDQIRSEATKMFLGNVV